MRIEECPHARAIVDRDENDDRTRTCEVCRICGFKWYGCCAKRLDDEGQMAWGPVGVWGYSEGYPLRVDDAC